MLTDKDIENLNRATTNPLFLLINELREKPSIKDASGEWLSSQDTPIPVLDFFLSTQMKRLLTGKQERDENLEQSAFFRQSNEGITISNTGNLITVFNDRVLIEYHQGVQQKISIKYNNRHFEFKNNSTSILTRDLDPLVKSYFGLNLEGLKRDKWIFSGLHFDKIPREFLIFCEAEISFENCFFENGISQRRAKNSVYFQNCRFNQNIQFDSSISEIKLNNCTGTGGSLKGQLLSISDSKFTAPLSVTGEREIRLEVKNSHFQRLDIPTNRLGFIEVIGTSFEHRFELSRKKTPTRDRHHIDDERCLAIENCHFEDGFAIDETYIGNGFSLKNLSFSRNSRAPTAFKADIHDASVWGNIKDWPIYRGYGKQDPEQMIHAYEYLRREMNKKQKHSEEKEFYRLEMLCRLHSEDLTRQVPNWLFWIFSDYGLSVWRPLQWLMGVWIFFAHIFAMLKAGAQASIAEFLFGIKLSASSVLGPFGMRREIFKRDELAQLDGWFHFVMGLESVLGIILIFLIGLAIRNQFRMRL